jgi:serine/threonine-protein kinase
MGLLSRRDPSNPTPAAGAPELGAEAEASLAEALAGRYELGPEAGRGGMAVVYEARDVRTEQRVAIKAMHRDLASALGTERFRREMGIAASLSHSRIVPLYDSGAAGDMLYYVMPYVEGESLYARLERERRLPLDDALRIAHDVADALDYSHSRGILHRDIKPENILLAGYPPRDPGVAGGWHALIADFGLARAIGAADYKKLTETGIIVGTVFYMSPEQLREDRNLDQRVDVYGLGSIVYEMLTGAPPFAGRSLTDLVMRILRDPPPSARRVNPAVPAALDEAIARALAKAPANRFATMQEFAAALPRPA